MEMQSMILSAKCPHDVSNKPNTRLRIKMWRIVKSQIFENVIMIVIVLNMF